jgi:hypothetical protein
MEVSEGVIPDGTEVYINHPYTDTTRMGRVLGYIAHTNAYLCAVGSKVQAYSAEQVMRPVPKFNSVEEADAWLEGTWE